MVTSIKLYFPVVTLSINNNTEFLENLMQGFKKAIFWLHVLIMSCTCFKVNQQSIVAWMSGNSLLEAVAKSEV